MALGDFWNRIRRLFRSPRAPSPAPRRPTNIPVTPRTPVVSPQPVVPQPTEAPAGPLDYATIIKTITDAARNNRVLLIRYDGMSRLVEPYSFREKSTGRLFYGYCSIHSRIHSFKPEKIESIEITDQVFAPRWEIEI
jgi:hypothetical protein